MNSDGTRIIAICTPLMRRIHEQLKESSELVFMDASGSMDTKNYRVFILLTHSVAGGLPLGVIILGNESTKSITDGLLLFQDLVGPKAFFGRGSMGPIVFMTDDSTAEREAIKNVYSQSKRLLCVFHVLNAYWRFLWNGKNKIELKDRPHLFYFLRRMAYSKTEIEFEKVMADLKTDPLVKENVLKYINKLYDRKEDWALFHRAFLPIRNNHTNNFVEAAMRVMKEKVLNRTKATCLAQLVDFIISGMERHYISRCVKFSTGRLQLYYKTRRMLQVVQSSQASAKKVEEVADGYYKCGSFTNDNVYVVFMDLGFCTCSIGITGGRCKHQALIAYRFNMQNQSFGLDTDSRKRQAFLQIATGEVKDISFFEILPTSSTSIATPLPKCATSFESRMRTFSQKTHLIITSHIQPTLMKMSHGIQLRSLRQPYLLSCLQLAQEN